MSLSAAIPFISAGVALTLLGFLLSRVLFRPKRHSAIPLDHEERNALLIDHAEAIIYTISPEGLMTYVSANWPRLLGHPTEQVVGQSFSHFVYPEDHPACYAFLERAVQTGKAQSGIEYRVLHMDGTLFWHTSSVRPVKDEGGRLVACVGIAHDITRMKEAQSSLREVNRRMVDLMASREIELREAIAQALFAAEGEARRIGHEIHATLCQELVGLARMTENLKRATMPSEEDRALLLKITEQSAHSSRLAREFAHHLTLHDLEVGSFAEAMAVFTARFEKLFGISVEFNCGVAPEVLKDAISEHLYRIISEAASNAVRRGRARRIWIDLVQEEDRLVLSVSNDGAPLPESGKIRDGLGLRQMRMRTRLMGGTLSLHPGEGGHTLLQVVIPRSS